MHVSMVRIFEKVEELFLDYWSLHHLQMVLRSWKIEDLTKLKQIPSRLLYNLVVRIDVEES